MADHLLPGVADAGRKAFRNGTHRTTAPAATLELLLRLREGLGITRIANITGLDRVGVPVVIACRPNSRSLSVSQGKGLDLIAAKVSAMMEAAEHYHAERIRLPLRLGSFEEFRHIFPVVPVDVFPFSTAARYHPTRRLLWIDGFDLVAQRTVLVPFELVHLNFTLPLPEGSGCFPPSSNGLASGNHLLEAVLHGACEIVERDAATLWGCASEQERADTRIVLDTVDDPACRDVIRRFERAGLVVGVWDITSDLGVPAFRCTILDREADPFRALVPVTGSGCHPAREIALFRALTEAAQGRLTMIAGSRDDIPRTDYARALDAEAISALREALSGGGSRRFSDVPTALHDSCEDDIGWILHQIQKAAIAGRLGPHGSGTLIVVDLSIQGLPISVVRVLGPGLEQQRMGIDYVPGFRGRTRLIRMQAPVRHES